MFWGTWLRVPQRVLFECFLAFFSPQNAQNTHTHKKKKPTHTHTPKKNTHFGALGARCPKTLKKHSGGHFPARAPEHSCKWRLGLQRCTTKSPHTSLQTGWANKSPSSRLRTEKAHKLFQHKLLPPTQNTPFWTPRKKVYVPHFLGKNAKKGPT